MPLRLGGWGATLGNPAGNQAFHSVGRGRGRERERTSAGGFRGGEAAAGREGAGNWKDDRKTEIGSGDARACVEEEGERERVRVRT